MKKRIIKAPIKAKNESNNPLFASFLTMSGIFSSFFTRFTGYAKVSFKLKKLKFIILPILLIFISANAQEILWHSIDAGGGVSTNSNDIKLIGVIGQADTIRMTGGNISLSAGYLPLPVKSDPIFSNSFE